MSRSSNLHTRLIPGFAGALVKDNNQDFFMKSGNARAVFFKDKETHRPRKCPAAKTGGPSLLGKQNSRIGPG